MSVITRQELMLLAPHAEGRIADALVAHADAAFARWGIATPARMQMFMAQIAVESAWLAKVFESMAYSGPRLWEVFGSRHFASLADAEAVAAQGQEAIANRVYGGRLGNVEPDDGWLCRGQGLIQTTGLANFQRLAAHMGQSVDVTRARLTSDEGMVDCAAATFHMLGALPHADRGDVEGCTKVVNGGLNGLADRQRAYALAKRVWPTMRVLATPMVGQTNPGPAGKLPDGAPIAPVPVAPPRHIDVITAGVPVKKSWWQRFCDALKREPA